MLATGHTSSLVADQALARLCPEGIQHSNAPFDRNVCAGGLPRTARVAAAPATTLQSGTAGRAAPVAAPPRSTERPAAMVALSPADIVLRYVCPAAGSLIALFMFGCVPPLAACCWAANGGRSKELVMSSRKHPPARPSTPLHAPFRHTHTHPSQPQRPPAGRAAGPEAAVHRGDQRAAVCRHVSCRLAVGRLGRLVGLLGSSKPSCGQLRLTPRCAANRSHYRGANCLAWMFYGEPRQQLPAKSAQCPFRPPFTTQLPSSHRTQTASRPAASPQTKNQRLPYPRLVCLHPQHVGPALRVVLHILLLQV